MGTTKKKNKYPADRKMQSNAIAEKHVAIAHYITSARTSIDINQELSDDVKHDLAHAIDDVLVYHGL